MATGRASGRGACGELAAGPRRLRDYCVQFAVVRDDDLEGALLLTAKDVPTDDNHVAVHRVWRCQA